MSGEPLVVDLGSRQGRRIKVFVGRERGREFRRRAGLDDADRIGRRVVVRIPHDTIAITPSFFLEMFGDSIRKLRKECFLARYSFVGWDARAVVEDGIREALSSANPFGE